jgi:hypothetical protein
MNRVTSREDLHRDIRLGLGEPIIKVELTPDQMDNAIDYALKQFWKYRADGSYESYFMYRVTADDARNNSIPIPITIESVVEVMPKAFHSSELLFMNPEWQIESSAMAVANGVGMPFGGGANTGGAIGGNERVARNSYYNINLYDWVIAQNYIDTLNIVTGASTQCFQFSKYTAKMTPYFPICEGESICMKVWQNVDPEADESNFGAWDDTWLKDMALAQAKWIWGSVLRKFGQVVISGGVTVDGQTLINEANEDINLLMGDAQKEMPTGMFWG